ncbi:MAG: molybdopterin-dependent oxidoreductase [Eggerthellaceae bacterium]|nr:molybdopterin-dependent oxidoreductase [Eggerthellaceae bacterium]
MASIGVETDQGKWIAALCWHNCGSRCLVKVLVKDGKVVRTKTDDTHADTWEDPQARACPMGYAMHQQITGADRILHPLKRKHWSPDAPNGELRGRDTWERISWDEAIDLAGNELLKARENYGNESILFMNIINSEGYLGQVLSAFGGYVDTGGTQSTGTFTLNTGLFGFEMTGGNDRMDLENSEYIVLYGHNAAWCAFGYPSLYLKHAKERGSKFVFVGPEYSATAGFTNAEWIPVRPGEDTALLLGVAYSMITRDQDGSLVDWDFLNRCTVGFDAGHMPADATTDESFSDYVLGKSDGIPKTQEWASELCGTPVELIDRLADILGCKHDVSIHSNGAPARCKGSENFPQMLMTIAAMGGHFGRPGNMCANDQYYGAMNNGAIALFNPSHHNPACFNNWNNPVDMVVPTDAIWDAVIEGEYWDAGNAWPVPTVHELQRRTCDIHVIVSHHNNFLASQANMNRGIEAFRKVDFVFANAYYLKADAQYADIVFPLTTRWENDQASAYCFGKDKEYGFAYNQVLEPLGEAKSDRDLCELLCAKIGVDYAELNPLSDRQRWFNQSDQAMVLNPAAADPSQMYIPLVETTQKDLDELGVEGAPHPGMVPVRKFLEDGVYHVKREVGDVHTNIGYTAFVADPEANPLGTASGKFEIYCQAKSDFYDLINGYANGGEGAADFVKVSPLPKYLEHPLGYRESRSDWETKEPGEYPIQMTHLHYLRRAHTDCDNLPWLREALRNPVFVNKADAEARGIKTGDTVRVFNGNGSFLRPACATRTVMPGVIMVPHGAGARFDAESGFDLSGADNVLTSSDKSTTPFLNGWNSNLVQYGKYEGPIDFVPDCEVEPVVPVVE